MIIPNKTVNLVLGGGGIKGIAFIGAFAVAEERGYSWANIAGVSAGALVGSFVAAGYSVRELRKILREFDFGKFEIGEIPKKVAAVSRYIQFNNEYRHLNSVDVEYFLNQTLLDLRKKSVNEISEFSGYRANLFKNIITYSKEGCLFDGDQLEQWVANILMRKGIRTFGDLKGGIKDKKNPRGYKVRMSAVDANRGIVLTLPDDIAFYGQNPDNLEVSKAVRMSTSVPFAFKPVEVKKVEGNLIKTYNIVDGGVLDNLPYWMIDTSNGLKTITLGLDGGQKKRLFSIDTPLTILKLMISAVHNLGIPKNIDRPQYYAKINTSKISFLDFNLSEAEKEYLQKAGVAPAMSLFIKLEKDLRRS